MLAVATGVVQPSAADTAGEVPSAASLEVHEVVAVPSLASALATQHAVSYSRPIVAVATGAVPPSAADTAGEVPSLALVEVHEVVAVPSLVSVAVLPLVAMLPLVSVAVLSSAAPSLHHFADFPHLCH